MSKTEIAEPKEPDANPEKGKTEIKKDNRGRKKKSSGTPAFSDKEMQEKLNIIFALIAKLFGKKYEYKAADFAQEAAALSRLAAKFDYVAKGMIAFDPLVIIAGLVSKFVNMANDPNKPNKNNKPSQPETGGSVVELGQQRQGLL